MMLATKMVCLIRKLFGRDENCPEEVHLRQHDTVDCRASEDDVIRDDVNDGQRSVDEFVTADRMTGESAPGKIMAESFMRERSRTVSIPLTSKSKRTATVATDADVSGRSFQLQSRGSSYAQKYSLRLIGDDVIECNDTTLSSASCELQPSFGNTSNFSCGAAEPVCCCDACNFFISHSCPSVVFSSVRLGSSENLSSGLPSVETLSDLHSTFAMLKMAHRNTPNQSKNFSPELEPEQTRQYSHLTGGAEQQSRALLLPPPVSISKDGEEGFAESQRLLVQNAKRGKAFSEVPPNKTICHVHHKFFGDK